MLEKEEREKVRMYLNRYVRRRRSKKSFLKRILSWQWNRYDKWYLWFETWVVAGFVGFLLYMFLYMVISSLMRGT